MRSGAGLGEGMSELPPILVFDLDGTLADTAPDLIATLNVLLAREGCRCRRRKRRARSSAAARGR